MGLPPGTTLGPYEIIALIGAGGMGEVYRARDPRLNREVAIKVLPADRVGDEERRRRFIQEAHAASALNHHNIITIYEIESANGNDFIVMEYVRGKSLDALIPRHGMRLSEALRIAIPVADALAAAHARGIIHRDLKPANVMVGADGAVKVLDFGLAKLIGSDSADDVELTHTAAVALSAPGTIAGTAPYMSPEQATAGPVDARSDIFSFGAMLYEMVTGARAFAGTSTAETLSAVIRAQPKAPSAVVAGIPSDLEKAILRCLRKDPDRRYQHIDDVKIALQDVNEESGSGAAELAPVTRTRRTWLLAALAATMLLILAAPAWLLLRRTHSRAAAPPMRVVPLTTLTGREFHPTFSPDAEQVAFQWNSAKEDNWDIYVTLVGSSDVRRLTSDPAPDYGPAWSPDGRQIAFLHEGLGGSTIQLVSVLGGGDRRVSDFRRAESIGWSPDGRWLIVARSEKQGLAGLPRGIFLVPVDGGNPRTLIASTPDVTDFGPTISPDNRQLAYVSCSQPPSSTVTGAAGCEIRLVTLDDARATSAPRGLGKQMPFIESLCWSRDGSAVIYGGQLTNLSDVSLWRAEVDGIRSERIEIAGIGALGPATARSRDRLAFTRLSVDTDIYSLEVGRRAQLLVGSTFQEMQPRLSPDGRRVVFGSQRSGDTTDIWMAQADGSNVRLVTRGPGRYQGSPYWSPDGRRVVFDSFGDDLHWHVWTVDTDGGTPRRLTTRAGDENVPTWSHDGRYIYFSADPGSGRDIWRMSASGGSTPERLTHGAKGPFACESADGKSLLFQAQDADAPLMVMPLAGGDARQLVGCVRNTAFGVGPQGIYYVPCGPESDPPVHVLDPKTGRDRRLGTLNGLAERPVGLSVSPDGNTIVYPRLMHASADLMLIENFR